MAVTEALVESIRQQVGDSSEPITGTIDSLASRRYARAIGETDPLYYDEEYARSAGYDGLVVPPNYLPSCMDWSDGGAEEDLRPDGTPTEEMKWVPAEGVRLMGGGEEMVFHAPCTVGTTVVLRSHLDEVLSKESKSGLMLILKIRNTFETSDGKPLMTSIRTVLGR